ncbi:MAG: YggT family protein [Streptococcaceae bacterium]|jgi:YggT family protein|nr:YggT family protein [Streptococcaceae bacterium]
MIVILIYRLLTLYSWVLIAYALMSWLPMLLPQLANSWVERVLRRLVSPYLRLFDRIPTRFGIFDFRVLIAYLLILFVQRLLLYLL